MTYGDIPTECGGINRVWRDHPKGRKPPGWSRHTRLIPTHEVGITHTLEQMSESINNTIQTELPRSGPPWGGCHLYGSRIDTLPRGECLYESRIRQASRGTLAKLRSSAAVQQRSSAAVQQRSSSASAHTSIPVSF